MHHARHPIRITLAAASLHTAMKRTQQPPPRLFGRLPAPRWPKLRFPSVQALRRVPLVMLLASVLAGLGIVQMTFLIGHAAYRSVTWTQQSARARQDIAQLRRDTAVLEQVQAHAGDPAYLAEVARCLGFVGVQEQVVLSRAAPQGTPEQGDSSPPTCEAVRLP